MENLNPGIKKTVHLLRSWGYNTIDSGDGVTRDFECDRGYPYVSMLIPLEEGSCPLKRADDLLLKLQKEFGISFKAVDEDDPCIQLSYDPVNRICILDLMNISDRDLE